MKKLYLIVNEDGLFCIKSKIRGETEHMAFGTEHLKEELKALGAERVTVPELKRSYSLNEL